MAKIDGFLFIIELRKNDYILVKELFDITDDEVRKTKIEDIANIVVEIVKYSFKNLVSSLGGKKKKN